MPFRMLDEDARCCRAIIASTPGIENFNTSEGDVSFKEPSFRVTGPAQICHSVAGNGASGGSYLILRRTHFGICEVFRRALWRDARGDQ